MNDDQIDDLKEFITAVITNRTSNLRGDITDMRGDIKELKNDVKRLDEKIDDLSASVAEAFDTSNEQTEGRLQDHETRLTALEAKAT